MPVASKFLNGVDVSRMEGTIEAVAATPKLGKFTFRVANRWFDGAENRTETRDFNAGGQEQKHFSNFTLIADEHDVLLGKDVGANPVEHLLHALASCVTTSMVYHASARGIAIEAVESSLDGDIDLQGFLGLNESVRKGFQQIRFKFRIKADVSDAELQELVALGPKFSPVFDTLTKGTSVSVSAERMR
jgi:uncharacterized OsmC-like protein